MNLRTWKLFSARCVAVAMFLLASFMWTLAPAGAQTVIVDDFGESHDYQFGDTTGTRWTGMENTPALSGIGFFDASITNAGVLTVEDNGTLDPDGDPANGISGSGWENGRSTSPFLFTEVPAGQDFTATVKINAQTSGTWSAAGLIARAGNSPTPPGIGTDHADENFVTAFSFRADAGITDHGTTLMKRIEGGVQMNESQVVVNNPTVVPNPAPPPDTVAVPLNPLPTYVRLERVGGGTAYRTWVSSDGTNFQFQSRVVPTVGGSLRDPGVPMQVGLSYMNFTTLAGTAQFDDFILETYDPLVAPGAPSISASATSFRVFSGNVLEVLITDATGGQGPLSWVRTPNLPGIDAMLPGANGGPASPLVPLPPESGSYFRWDTMGVDLGTYNVMITATNDWGQASNPLGLTITIVIPEPSYSTLIGLALIGMMTMIRRSTVRWERESAIP